VVPIPFRKKSHVSLLRSTVPTLSLHIYDIQFFSSTYLNRNHNMGILEDDLSISMTMAAFIGISWYIGIEINFSLFFLFSRWRGLYFWSCALCSWGVILQPLFIILADFGVWTNLTGSITMIYLTWSLMVVPQSWVLYSRLHLMVQRQKFLRGIWIVLIFNSIVFSVPTIVIGTIAVSYVPNH
jgi:hypothetical protein